MAGFKHHKYFPKERHARSFLFPHVCLACRKSFKKPASPSPRPCPECAQPLVQLSRKFKAPRVRDIDQWKKVALLIEHGFLFYSHYERRGPMAYRVEYPRTLAQAHDFIARFAGHKSGG
jgi:predicted amidophosphoribosyltransferase